MSGVILPHIGLIGKMGAGKTEVAKILSERFGYDVLSFSEPLKVGCGTRDDRGLLQKVGHGVRELFPDFWVNLALAEVARLESDEARKIVEWQQGSWPPKFVNDTVRYPNEAKALEAAGWVLVRVNAPRWLRADRQRKAGRLQDESQLDHVGETALDGYPVEHFITNDGWPEDLLEQVTAVVNRLRS